MRFVRWLVSATFVSAMVSAPVQAQGQDPETEAFVRGFVRFLAYHEAGHMLMGQIADMNRDPDWTASDKEDYADRFAMILLAPDADDADGVDEIVSAAGGWLQVDSSAIRDEPHAPAEVRALEILCLLYGSNPSAFGDFAQYVPEGRDCSADYKLIEADVEEVFRDYSGQMGRQIEISYFPPAGGMENAQRFLRDSGIVEDLKLDIEYDFYLTHRTTIQAMSCTDRAKPDTFYSDRFKGATPESDHFVITLCYEMIDHRLKFGLRGFEDSAQ